MGEKLGVERGLDWCTLKISDRCMTRFYSRPDKCFLLSDQVRICDACLAELYGEQFPEDCEWVLRQSAHEGFCNRVTITLSTDEEVTFCLRCVLEVLQKSPQTCTCSCHESGQCDGHLLFCSKCGGFTKIDVIYMTREQRERVSQKN